MLLLREATRHIPPLHYSHPSIISWDAPSTSKASRSAASIVACQPAPPVLHKSWVVCC